MAPMIRAVIVDDEDLSRRALGNLLKEMPDVECVGECRNGFEAVETIPKLKPDLVFLDIQMPQLNGFDVIELLGEQVPSPISFAPFIESHQAHSAPLSRILVRDGQEIHIVPTAEIMYVKAEDDYVMLHALQKSLLKLERLSRLEKMLDPRFFCRIHRSYLLNIAFLERIEAPKKESRVAVLKNEEALPISRQGFGHLQKLLNAD